MHGVRFKFSINAETKRRLAHAAVRRNRNSIPEKSGRDSHLRCA